MAHIFVFSFDQAEQYIYRTGEPNLEQTHVVAPLAVPISAPKALSNLHIPYKLALDAQPPAITNKVRKRVNQIGNVFICKILVNPKS